MHDPYGVSTAAVQLTTIMQGIPFIQKMMQLHSHMNMKYCTVQNL